MSQARSDGLEQFVEAGRQSLSRLRETGWVPSISSQGRSRVGPRTSEVVRAAREWQRTHPWPEAGTYERAIRPIVDDASPTALHAPLGCRWATADC